MTAPNMRQAAREVAAELAPSLSPTTRSSGSVGASTAMNGAKANLGLKPNTTWEHVCNEYFFPREAKAHEGRSISELIADWLPQRLTSASTSGYRSSLITKGLTLCNLLTSIRTMGSLPL
jgi:hypothetical protein